MLKYFQVSFSMKLILKSICYPYKIVYIFYLEIYFLSLIRSMSSYPKSDSHETVHITRN